MTDRKQSSDLYAWLWRWHLYAGLILGPFIILLALTGLLYLFQPQLDPLLLAKYKRVPVGGAMVSYDRQLDSALSRYPGSTLVSFTYNRKAEDATEVVLKEGSGSEVTVYVNPYTAEVVGAVEENRNVMPLVRKLHSGMFAGDNGRIFMELVACWTIVLLISGLYLWWPRLRGLDGVVRIRRREGQRRWLRDLHAVPAALLSGLVFVWLITGLPWTIKWGGYFDQFQYATKTAAPPAFGPSPFKAPAVGSKTVSMDALVDIQKRLIPDQSSAIYWPWDKLSAVVIRADPLNPEHSAYLHVDQYSGHVYADYRWKDFGILGKLVSYSVSFHQGKLFGWPNMVLGVLVTTGVTWMAGTGIYMWWKRRPAGGWGIPSVPDQFVISRKIRCAIVALGIFLPVFGASVLFIWLLDRIRAVIRGRQLRPSS